MAESAPCAFRVRASPDLVGVACLLSAFVAGCGSSDEPTLSGGKGVPSRDSLVSYAAPSPKVKRGLRRCLEAAGLRADRNPRGSSIVAFDAHIAADPVGVIELPHGGRVGVNLAASPRAAARAAALANRGVPDGVGPINHATPIRSVIIGVALDPPIGRRSDLAPIRRCAPATQEAAIRGKLDSRGLS